MELENDNTVEPPTKKLKYCSGWPRSKQAHFVRISQEADSDAAVEETKNELSHVLQMQRDHPFEGSSKSSGTGYPPMQRGRQVPGSWHCHGRFGASGPEHRRQACGNDLVPIAGTWTTGKPKIFGFAEKPKNFFGNTKKIIEKPILEKWTCKTQI